ncbi:sigma-70 family RNA polymerase sigma factor [Lentisphaera profundi]|uniref:Sigma-70 family RNA polymerase sigma factor n=1 Tax=Lentisphaera profundi TaxID=1658616 RepID=A0ABY7VTU1_9BACT|nr:sigma-70 family RNA polymerase sigma factor [Lentisphaera profundi]WDE97147.1 sigma-70 family RNA polymerase sigma factor [Lentisphaera profundi]
MKQTDNTRHTLLQKIKDPNNESSWEEFVEYYSGYIYVIIRSFRVDIEDSEDLLQDVLIKVWKGIRQYDQSEKRSKFRTWLCSVIRNTVFNFLKSKSVKNSKQNVSYNEALEQMNLINEAEVDKIAEKEWQNYVANLAWANIKNDLSEANCQIFEDSISGELNNAELAQKHGIAETSVRVYKMRVKKALSKEIVRLNNELSW